jgi:anti-sigma-K factor RskA
MSNQEHIVELIPAYALDCLDEQEALQVAGHLALCASCRDELTTYEAVVNQLALAVPDVEPPADLKERLMAQIEPSAKVEALDTAVSRQRMWPWPGTAALEHLVGLTVWRPAVALVIILLLISNIILWRQLSQDTLSPDGFQHIALEATEVNSEARGMIVINRSGHNGTLIVDGLPALDESHQYQLWLLYNGEREDGGTFSVYRNGYYAMLIHATESLDQYTAFGITIEPAGGSPGPTGTRVLGGSR